MLCILGSLYTRIIEDWELSNMRHPTARVKRFKINTRERFLTPEERQRMQDAIEAGLRIPSGRKGHLEPSGVWALQLLALTGLRRSEVVDLTWTMVDWQHSCLRLPDTKTGKQIVHISSQVVALLRHIHDQTGSSRRGRVVGSRTGAKLVSLNRTWETVRAAIDIPDVRLHDLRHSFASDALMGGVPLAVVGEMLGHRQPNTTKRYAHLANHVVRDAVEFTAGRIVAASTTTSPHASTPFTPLRDDQWSRVAPLVDARRPRGDKPVDLRRIVDGIRWTLHSKARWRDMPAIYGKSTTTDPRRWIQDTRPSCATRPGRFRSLDTTTPGGCGPRVALGRTDLGAHPSRSPPVDWPRGASRDRLRSPTRPSTKVSEPTAPSSSSPARLTRSSRRGS